MTLHTPRANSTPTPRSLIARAVAMATGADAGTVLAWRPGLAGGLLAAVLAAPSLAGPEGAHVVRGNVSITRDGNQTVIRAGDRSIINYRNFNIGANESVRFVQPNESSRVLNRINSAAPTRIDGSLLANGRVYIVNPAGVVFGQNATVNVAGLFAGAGRMSDADFVRGVDRVTGMSGSVINEGSINARSVSLVGATVANVGQIVAPDGAVAMAAGRDVVVTSRDSAMHVRVSGQALEGTLGAAITNTGAIDAPRGRVVMAAGDVYGMAIRASGTTRAKDVRVEGKGRGAVVVDGTIDARDQRAALRIDDGNRVATTTGGTIEVTGQHVGLFGATLDASGASGGGRVLIGGDIRGRGDLANADVIAVNETTTVRADATRRGDGGDVVFYADDTARVHAAVSAKGGAQGGDGGFIETSGKQHLSVNGSRLDASASAGRSGEWLIDPRNVNIVAGATGGGSFGGDTPDVFTPSADDSTVSAADIATRLDAGTSVTVTTGATGSQDGDIRVQANITRTAGSGSPTLRLEAANSIIVESGVAITAAGGGELNVEMIANHGGDSDPNPAVGQIRIESGASITTAGGDLVLAGGDQSIALGTDPLSAGFGADLRASAARGTASDPVGVRIDGATIDTGAGSIMIRGVGFDSASGANAAGVQIENAASVIGGAIDIYGAGGNVTNALAGNNNIGVRLITASSVVGSAGAMNVVGLGASTVNGTGAAGLVVAGSTLSNAGSGALTVVGVGATGTADLNHGVLLTGGAGQISTAGGDLTITGTSRTSGMNSSGVEFAQGSTVRVVGAGDLTVTGTAINPGLGTSGILGGAGGATVGDAGHTGTLALRADTVVIDTLTFPGTASGVVAPRTNVTAGIGSGTTGTFNLDDAELALFQNFADVTFGATTSGLMTTSNLSLAGFAGRVTLAAGSLNTAGVVADPGRELAFNVAGAANQTGAVIADSLLFLGGGQYVFTNTSNDVNTVAGSTSGSGSFFADSDGFSIGSVGSATGFVTTAGSMELRAVTGAISVDAEVAPAAGSVLTLTADTIDFTVNAAGDGALALQPVTISRDVRVGGGAQNPGEFAVSDAQLAFLNNVGSRIFGRANGTGTLTLAGPTTFTADTTLRMGGSGGEVVIGDELRGTGGSITLAGATNRLGADIITDGQAITITGPAVLETDFLADTSNDGAAPNGADVTFTGTVDADLASNDRVLEARGGTLGDIVFGGQVGGSQRVSRLTASGGSIALNGVDTRFGQAYSGPVALDGALTSLFSGDIRFNSTLAIAGDSTVTTAGGADDHIVVAGEISGAAGDDLTLDAGDGRVELLGGGVASGDQTFRGSQIVLDGDVTGEDLMFDAPVLLDSFITTVTGTSSVLFASTIDSRGADLNSIIINSPSTTIQGNIGATGTLGLFETDAAGTTTLGASIVRTVGDQNYNDNVVLTADLDAAVVPGGGFPGDGRIFINGTLNSDGSPRDVRFATTTAGVNLFGPVGNTSPLGTLTVADGSGVSLAANITTIGAQRYTGAALLEGDMTLRGSSITFDSTLDSSAPPRDLTLVATAGDIRFNDDVGGVTQLRSLDATASNGIILRSVETSGPQEYTGFVSLSGELASVVAGGVEIEGTLEITGNSILRTAGATAGDDISVTGFVNARGGDFSLTANAGSSGTVLFASPVGTRPDATHGNITAFTVTGASVGLRQVVTTGSQLYTGATTLNGNLSSTGSGGVGFAGPVTLLADTTITTAAGDIVINGALDSDETARALTLNTGGSGNTRLGGQVGFNRRLASLTTNADGTTTIAANQVRTTGDQVYNDAVRLALNSTIEANDIQFLSTIDSDNAATPRNLTLNSAASGTDTGETVLGGRVGGVTRLGSLTTNADGTTRVNASVSTTRAMTFNDGVLVGNSITLDSSTAGLFFRNAIDADTSATDPVLTLRGNTTGDVDSTTFRFGGNIGSNRRLGGLNIGDNRSPAQAATILFTDAYDAQGRVTASGVSANDTFRIITGATGFTMGRGQKLTALGSINISSTGGVALGDVSALNNIAVTGQTIAINLRPGGQVQDRFIQSPDQTQPDPGVDFVAGGTIDFSVTPTTVGTGVQPTFSAGSGRDAQLSGFITRSSGTPISVGTFVDSRVSGGGTLLPLDLRASGPSQTPITTAIIMDMPPVGYPGSAVAPTATPEDAALLAELGISTRPTTFDERVESLSGRSFEDRVWVGGTLASSGIPASRMSGGSARRVIDLYRALVQEPLLDEGGSQQLDEEGRPRSVSRTAEVRDTLARSWENYASKVVTPTGEGWRAYLESMGSTGSAVDEMALRYLDITRDLLGAIEDLGLSPREMAAPRSRIVGEVKPDAIPEAAFLEAVDADRRVALAAE